MRGLSLGLGLSRNQGRPPAWQPSGLFALDQPGIWLDGSDNSVMWQDAAGTIPVTELGQPVGLILDKRLWEGKTYAQVMAGQAELWQHSAAFTTGGSQIIGENSYRIFTPDTSISYVANAGALTLGKFYEVTFNIDSIAVVGAGIRVADNGAIFNTTGPKRSIVMAIHTAAFIKSNGVACDYQISNVSVKEIPGNHATQSTDALRPICQIDANGKPGLQFDGVDDFLVTPSIDFSASGKMLVAAGVRKLSDANHYTIVDLPSGTFHALGFPRSTSVVRPYIASGGVERRGDVVTGAASALITGLFDNAGVTDADKLKLRYNGADVGTIGGSGATVSFSNTTMEIGRRRTPGNYFDGFIHQLVVRGGALPDVAELAKLEAFIAQQTGVSL